MGARAVFSGKLPLVPGSRLALHRSAVVANPVLEDSSRVSRADAGALMVPGNDLFR